MIGIRNVFLNLRYCIYTGGLVWLGFGYLVDNFVLVKVSVDITGIVKGKKQKNDKQG